MGTTYMVRDSTSFSAAEPAQDDLALVHACKQGNAAAFEELVKRHERKLFRIAEHVTHNPEDARDVVQEAFLKAFRSLSQFRETSQFSTWLVRITINQALMKVRKPHRKKEVAIDQEFQTKQVNSRPNQRTAGRALRNDIRRQSSGNSWSGR